MKKVILCMLLVSGLFANNIWNQEYGAGKTYTSIVNDKNVDFTIACGGEDGSGLRLANTKGFIESDTFTIVTKEGMVNNIKSNVDLEDSKETLVNFDNGIKLLTNTKEFVIVDDKNNKYEFVVKPNKSGVKPECSMMESYEFVKQSDDRIEEYKQQQEQYVDKPLYKLNPSVHYINSPYQDMLLMEAISLVDGLIVYDVIINNEANGCISTEKAHNEKKVKNGSKVEYKTMKKFEKTIFRYPNNKCEIMQIDVFTNMGNFTHTLY